MTRVHLGASSGAAQVPPPVRHALSRAALEELARLTGTPLPSLDDRLARRSAAADLACALGDRGGQGPTVAAPDPTAELLEQGLVVGGAVHAPAAAALHGVATADSVVDLELALLGPAGTSILRSRHHRHLDGVTALTTAGEQLELAWWPQAAWAGELARLVTPPDTGRPTPRPGEPAPPAAYLRLPYELLLASGAAFREGRAEVVGELVARSRGLTTGRDGTALTPACAAAQVARMHGAARGRLQATVSTRRSGRLGLLTWVLYADGWRELVPVRGCSGPTTLVRAVDPGALGGSVARMVAAVAP